MATATERELEGVIIGLDLHTQPTVRAVALREKRLNQGRIRWLIGLAHALFFFAVSPDVQAEHGAFVSAGSAVELRGARGDTRGPVEAAGHRTSVEVGWLIPGGTIFQYELGIRAAASEVGLLGGARAELLEGPGVLRLMPYVRGGLSVGWRDREVVFGPYAALGVSRALGAGSEVTLAATLFTSITPFTAAVGASITFATF